MSSIPERFLPVEPVVRQILAEKYPKLSTHPGSAIHDVFVLPAAAIYQRLRDTARVIYRNQSLSNYNAMLPEELDRLAANFLITRRQSTGTTGIQRVYFDTVRSTTIPAAALFTDTNGNTYKPISSVSVTAAELAANTETTTGEYYIDVPIVSTGTGSAYRAQLGQITGVLNVVGAVRTVNITAMSGGVDAESNSELYARIKTAMTNRELVKRDGILGLLSDTFPSIKTATIHGYGDKKQKRDVVSAAISYTQLFPLSVCRKINLPIDTNGEVVWSTSNTQPTGGFVGAIYDVAGRDFQQLLVSLDGHTVRRISVQEGYRVRILDSDDPDAVNNDFVVTRVERVPLSPEGDPVLVLRVDRAFNAVSEENTEVSYTVDGPVYLDDVHIGGKLDVIVDTTNEEVKQVVINTLLPVTPDSDVAEIPLLQSVTDDLGNSIFENNLGFISPVIAIQKVEQLDLISDTVVRELLPDVHFSVIRADVRGKFTQIATDMLVIRGTEFVLDPETGSLLDEPVPLFIGQRIRVSYITNSDIQAIQTFVDRSANKNLAVDIKILPPEYAFASIELSYAGDVSEAVAQEILGEYVTTIGFGKELTASDVTALLYRMGASHVQQPIRLIIRRDLGNGASQLVESDNRLATLDSEVLRVGTLQLTKIS